MHNAFDNLFGVCSLIKCVNVFNIGLTCFPYTVKGHNRVGHVSRVNEWINDIFSACDFIFFTVS